MGCGQSQFSLIHPKKQRRKDRRNKDNSDEETDEDEEDKFNRNGRLISNRSTSNLVAAVKNEESLADTSKIAVPNESYLNTTLFAHREMSLSQYEFFRALDEKIENGPDYDEFSEKERQLENARIRQLLSEWERAKHKRLLRSHQNQMAQTENTALMSSQIRSLSRIAPASQVRLQPSHMAGLQMVQFTAIPEPSTSACKSQFTVPLLNGDINEPHHAYVLRNRVQYFSPQKSQPSVQNHSLSNSIVMYDEARGQFYTELV